MKRTYFLGTSFDQADVVRAMDLFDNRYRSTFPQQRWKRYAVEHKGRQYPPKQLLRLIISRKRLDGGGSPINSRFELLGFRIVTIPNAANLQLLAEEADDSDLPADDEYSPGKVDHRELVARQIRARRGQRVFRDGLRKRYQNRCLVTGCRIVDILEAAHIQPYRGDNDNHPANGLLLRADIHTLFDLNLLGVEPARLRIELHPSIMDEYGEFAGKPLLCPKADRPSQEALDARYRSFCARNEGFA